MANEANTNIKYLSLIITQHKKKTFIAYLNELRINYVIQELKQNPVLYKYTIKTIANEMGYKSAETFSIVIYKQIKIKPSFYIKQLMAIKSSKEKMIRKSTFL